MPKTLRASDLANFAGSVTWWRHPLNSRITYTDGARHVAQAGQAYWLLDAIVSHQHDPKVAAEAYQVWTLEVAADRTALLSCEDGDHNPITVQQIAFTDFPLPEIQIWFQGNVIFLPSEY